jgi:hypothetical protein
MPRSFRSPRATSAVRVSKHPALRKAGRDFLDGHGVLVAIASTELPVATA